MTTAIITTHDLTVVNPLPLDQQPAAVYVAGLAAGSRRTMRDALDKIADMLIGGATALTIQWAALRFQHTAAIRAKLADVYSAATANKMLSALRGVLKAAWRLGQIDSDDYARAVDLDRVAGSTLPAGRALTAGEIAALLESCAKDATAAGARDSALIAVLRAGGLRRAEVCDLDIDDYNAAAGVLRVNGKRNKEREVPIGGGTVDALADWLTVRGNAAGPLFCPVNKGGRVEVRRMNTDAVFAALQKRAGQAGIANLSPHDLRRTFASDLLDAGADIATVAKLMGHAAVTTTARYDRRGESAKRRAIDLLHVPYTRRKISGAVA